MNYTTYQCAEGRPHTLPEISFLVRDGKLGREEACKILEAEWLHEKPQAEMKELFDFIGQSDVSTRIKAQLYNKVISKWK